MNFLKMILQFLWFLVPRFVTDDVACRIEVHYNENWEPECDLTPLYPVHLVTPEDDAEWNCVARMTGLSILGWVPMPTLKGIPVMRDGTPAWSEDDE